MNMSGNIRVRTVRRYRGLYNDLKNFVAKDMHEIFFLCTCIGYLNRKRKPLGKDGDDRFWSNTITPDEYANYYAMIIESNDMNFSEIPDDKGVIEIVEEYANAGMEILLEEILSDYTIKRNDDFQLDPSCSKELPKVMLAYIYGKAGEQMGNIG